ncbi:MAG: hypothetical protein AAGF94_16500 [Pseudomonadota bacterium]
MIQPVLSDCLFLDLHSHLQDLCVSAKLDFGQRQVAEALVVRVVVVVIDEVADRLVQGPGKVGGPCQLV